MTAVPEPFGVFEVEAACGRLGFGPAPGRGGGLDADLDHLQQLGVTRVLTLVTMAELEMLKAVRMAERLARRGITWLHHPITDFGTPGAAFRSAWPRLSRALLGHLVSGGFVYVHCMGGCGRSGMIVMRLLVEQGATADAALLLTRTARGCAIETPGQLAWARAAGAGGDPA